jgi:hypothetical protein
MGIRVVMGNKAVLKETSKLSGPEYEGIPHGKEFTRWTRGKLICKLSCHKTGGMVLEEGKMFI